MREAEKANRESQAKTEMLCRTEEFNRNILDKSACGIVSYRLPKHDNMYLNAEALRVFGCRDIAEAQTELPRTLSAAIFNDQAVLDKLIELKTKDGAVDFECQITNSKGRTSLKGWTIIKINITSLIGETQSEGTIQKIQST